MRPPSIPTPPTRATLKPTGTLAEAHASPGECMCCCGKGLSYVMHPHVCHACCSIFAPHRRPLGGRGAGRKTCRRPCRSQHHHHCPGTPQGRAGPRSGGSSHELRRAQAGHLCILRARAAAATAAAVEEGLSRLLAGHCPGGGCWWGIRPLVAAWADGTATVFHLSLRASCACACWARRTVPQLPCTDLHTRSISPWALWHGMARPESPCS